jgi:hypothetical protein
MGPQPVGQLFDLLRECEAVELGLMHDASPGGVLTLAARADRYNAAPTLIVDNAREQLANGFEPVYDSTNLRTVSTVKRSGGSSATYAADTSQGTRPDEVTLNLYDDSHLYEIAGWRANSLSMKRLRYPQLGINLRKSPELQAAWLATKLGARALAINLPQQHGPTGATADVCVEGYVEIITSETWTSALICSPAEPYNVAVMEGVGDAAWRVDTDGASLNADITTTAPSCAVTTAAGNTLFTTSGIDYPANIDIDGEQIRVDAVGSVINANPWLITDASGWSGDGSTLAWSMAQRYDAAYGSLLVTPTAGALPAYARSTARVAGTATVQYQIGAWVRPTTAWASGFRVGVDWYTATVGGTYISTTFHGTAVVLPANTWTYVSGVVTAPATTGGGQLFVVQSGTPAVTDLWYASGITYAPVGTVTSSPQTFMVTRSINGVVKTHKAGAAVKGWRLRPLAL